MATAPAPYATTPAVEQKRELIVISHSSLFYWWPVWAVGFLMAAITWFGGERMSTVPAGTKPVTGQDVAGFDGKRDILVLPKDGHLTKDRNGNPAEPKLRMTANKNLGVLFCIVLLLVVAITNIPLRGLWSVIVIIVRALVPQRLAVAAGLASGFGSASPSRRFFQSAIAALMPSSARTEQ